MKYAVKYSFNLWLAAIGGQPQVENFRHNVLSYGSLINFFILKLGNNEQEKEKLYFT